MPSEVAPGIFRLVLPLGIHGVSTLNAYLITDPSGDTLVDCGVYVRRPQTRDGRSHAAEDGGTWALAEALVRCGSSLDRLGRLVVTHAHVDHFGIAGEVVRRCGGELWMHAETDKDLAKYEDPDEAVDTRMLMLADHGLYGEALAEASSGLHDWIPVMPSIGTATTRLYGGERFRAGGRIWQVVHTPGHSPGHICLWSATDRLLCSGDHLIKGVSPPVTFERGLDPDPMGSYLASLEAVQRLEPALVLPGHGPLFSDGAGRAQAIAKGKRQRLRRVLELLERQDLTVADMTAAMFRPGLTGTQLHFAMAEVLAYLAYHRARGRVERHRRPNDRVFVWHRTEGQPAGA